MNQIRIAALSDLKKYIPDAHYLLRPHSIDADLEFARSLLQYPEGLALNEHRAAQALQDWAFFEKRFRAISSTANPARDCDDDTPAPGMTPDQDQELTALREVHRRSALAYAITLGDAQLIERYQPPAPATDIKPVPIQRAHAQDAAILREIRKQGFNPLELPKNAAGKKGVKHGIRTAIGNSGLFIGTTIFDKAWERLTANSEIVIKG